MFIKTKVLPVTELDLQPQPQSPHPLCPRPTGILAISQSPSTSTSGPLHISFLLSRRLFSRYQGDLLLHLQVSYFPIFPSFPSFFCFFANIQFSQHLLIKRLFFLHWIAFAHSLKISCPYIYGSISGFYFLFHRSICLLLCQYHSMLITVTSWQFWKSSSKLPWLL